MITFDGMAKFISQYKSDILTVTIIFAKYLNSCEFMDSHLFVFVKTAHYRPSSALINLTFHRHSIINRLYHVAASIQNRARPNHDASIIIIFISFTQ